MSPQAGRTTHHNPSTSRRSTIQAHDTEHPPPTMTSRETATAERIGRGQGTTATEDRRGSTGGFHAWVAHLKRVLLESVRSAEPPMSSGSLSAMALITAKEDLRVAWGLS